MPIEDPGPLLACPECGATVAAKFKLLHERWHRDQREVGTEIEIGDWDEDDEPTFDPSAAIR